MPVLTDRYQAGLARLRDAASSAIGQTWDALESYDDVVVNEFVAGAGPLVTAAQRQAVVLTDAYLALATQRAPLGLDVDELVGAAVRAGTPPEQVYARPFVNVWMALKNGTPWVDAVKAGRARATSSAAMDVALSARATASKVGELDERIVGFQRVTNPGAYAFCTLVAGQRYRVSDLMPVHNHCGCTVEPILGSERGRFSGNQARDLDLPVSDDGATAAVREHGELGPVLVDGTAHFTDAGDLDL